MDVPGWRASKMGSRCGLRVMSFGVRTVREGSKCKENAQDVCSLPYILLVKQTAKGAERHTVRKFGAQKVKR